MDENARKGLSAVIDALEHYWLESHAAQQLLQICKVPNWSELLYKYCERPEAKALARKQFAVARALIQQAQTDSKALEALVSTLGTPERPKN